MSAVIHACINTLRPSRNRRHFADDIFKCIFLKENVWIPIKISLKIVPTGPINNILALVQVMAWRRPGDKPLSELTKSAVCSTTSSDKENARSLHYWFLWQGNPHVTSGFPSQRTIKCRKCPHEHTGFNNTFKFQQQKGWHLMCRKISQHLISYFELCSPATKR